MTPIAIVELIIQIITAVQPLVPEAVKAVEDFKALFADGATPTQADIDALILRVQAQSAQIQAID